MRADVKEAVEKLRRLECDVCKWASVCIHGRKIHDAQEDYWCSDDGGIRKIADLLKQLTAELEQVKMERDGLDIMLTSATSAFETIKRERDAAINELSYMRKCSNCGKHMSEGGNCWGNHECGNSNPEWRWRGVQENERRINDD